MEYIITTRRPKSIDECHEAWEAAARDGWVANTVPTHILRHGDAIVGYWSFGNMPLMLAWHSSDMKTRETLQAFEAADMAADANGISTYITALQPDSPYVPHMERLGFKELGDAKLYIKEV